MEQLNLDDFLCEKYQVKNVIKCIEFFAGYGSTTLAWKYVLDYYNKNNKNKIKYEHHKICEWAVNSIIAYASLHRNKLEQYGNDFCKDLTKEEIANKLFSMGVSVDYNKPATLKQLKSMSEDKLRLCFNSIMWSNNLVDISRTKGEDLKIEKNENTTYFLSYSFPCQDISNAGLSKGFSKSGKDKFSSETRSGLLWQVERILSELYEKGKEEGDSSKYLPDILFCENVPLIESKGENLNNLIEWKNFLESIGYSNKDSKLQATDYGIPQTRNRFFMFSFLSKGDIKYTYKFPKPLPLKLKLKDLLENEDDVDEKYYLSERMIQCFMSDGTGKYPRRERFLQNICRENQDVANSITTLAGNRATDNFVLLKIKNKSLIETLEKNDIDKIKDVAFIDGYNRNIKTDGNSGTITTRIDASNNNYIAIKNATKKGFLLAKVGDGIDISSRMESHRGTVQKDKSQTITTMGGENVGVVVGLAIQKKDINKNNKNGYIVFLKRGYTCEVKEEQENPNGIDVVDNYSKSNYNQTSIVGKNGIAPTVTENHGQVTAIPVIDKVPKVIGGLGEMKSNNGTQFYQQDRIYDDNVAISVTTDFNPYYASIDDDTELIYLRIRKLTPKECFRLQGVKDQDYFKIKQNQPDSKQYHLAGDSICCYGPLAAMYCELLGINFKDFFDSNKWWENE